jgi:hypothetical protein
MKTAITVERGSQRNLFGPKARYSNEVRACAGLYRTRGHVNKTTWFVWFVYCKTIRYFVIILSSLQLELKLHLVRINI